MWILIDGVIQEEGFYAYNLHTVVEKHKPGRVASKGNKIMFKKS
jgi:hypothetical protein